MLDTDRLVALDAGEGTVLLLFQRGAVGGSGRSCRAGWCRRTTPAGPAI